METENGIEITYNEVGNVIIKIDSLIYKEGVDGLLNDVLDTLGDADIVTCNEINGNEPSMLIDSDRGIFFLTDKDLSDLETSGDAELDKQGTLKNFINLEDENHVDFLKWYYAYDTAEEAINAMQTETCN